MPRLKPVKYDRISKRIDILFERLNEWGRIAARYDKTAESSLTLIDIRSIQLWFRLLSSRPDSLQRSNT